MHHIRRPILRFVLRVITRPWWTLGVTLSVTAICVGLAVWRLSISTDQSKLFSRDVPFFRDFVAFGKEFPENEGLYVVVQARDVQSPPGAGRWAAVAEAVAARVRGLTGEVRAVSARVSPEELGRQGILFESPAEMREEVEGVRRMLPMVRIFGEAGGVTALLGKTRIERFLGAFGAAGAEPETARFVSLVVNSWTQTLRSAAAGRPVLPDLALLGGNDPRRMGYFYVPDQQHPERRLLLIKVVPREDYTSLTAISENVEAIRAAVAEGARGFPEFDVGVTGRPALDADEMRTTDTDSTRAEIVALTAVFIGLVALLRSVWLAVAAELALGVGIAWTFGWATLTLGELNLLSIVFMLALIGIGMDYLVQILSRYRSERAARNDPRRIWVAVFRQVGAPINTATLGAAGAFLVSMLTDFEGAADLGLIAGGGLILCLLAGYTFLPALLTVWPGGGNRMMGRWGGGEMGSGKKRMMGSGGDGEKGSEGNDMPPPYLPISPSISSSSRWWLGPAIWGVLLAVGVPFAMKTRFNPGLLELQAPHLRSVQLVRKLETWSAVVLSRDLNALRAARDRLAGAQTVGRTESVLDAWDNYEALKKSPLPEVAWAEPGAMAAEDVGRIVERAEGLAEAWEKGSGFRVQGSGGEAADAVAALRGFVVEVRKVDAAEAAKRLSAWEVGFIGDLKEMLAAFRPGPPDLATAPAALREHLIGQSGVYALNIYPKKDLWNQANLVAFVKEVEGRIGGTPGVTLTGIAHNIAHSTAAIRSSFIRSTLYALGLIVLLVWIDLRRVGQTLAAISVLGLGLPMLVALMGLFRVDWNFANFFGLPILIGAGHEYGVFLVHRYREALGYPRRRAWAGWDVADRALLLCAFVTSSSFGFFFLLAHHRGLKSLGLVMALGSACIYLASVVAVRPLLRRRLSRLATNSQKNASTQDQQEVILR